MITLGITGTAGRGQDQHTLEEKHWQLMLQDVCHRVKKLSEQGDIYVISGGAAWADHLAIPLFRCRLATEFTLIAPCDWDMDNRCYLDTGERNWRTNSGGTANYYHRKFNDVCGFASLWEIHRLFKSSAANQFHYTNGEGFLERNSLIAERCDCLLAYTTGEGDTPRDGGTLDTWNKCSKEVKKMHIPILNLPKSPLPW